MAEEPVAIKALVQFVFADELVPSDRSNDSDSVAVIERTFEKTRERLAILLGSAGYQVLLRRALALATVEFPSVATIRTSADGILEGYEAIAERDDACACILTKLLELLEMFIGRELTMRLLHDAWPNAMPIGVVPPAGESNG